MVEEYSYQVNQLCNGGGDGWPSLCVVFQSNMMQTKLIQDISFVGKETYETVRGIKFVQTDKMSEKRMGLDVVVQTHRILIPMRSDWIPI